MFDPNDLVGALLYHRELIERSETPQERGLAVYLVISGVTGEDHFLAGLQPYWDSWTEGFVAQTDNWLLQSGLAANPAEVAAAYARRDTYVASTHQWIIYYWRRGPKESDDPHIATMERTLARAYSNDAAILKIFMFCVALNSNASDADLLTAVQLEMDSMAPDGEEPPRLASSPPGTFANAIAEARRATRQGFFGGMMKSMDETITSKGIPAEDLPSARRAIVRRLLGLNLRDEAPVAINTPRGK